MKPGVLQGGYSSRDTPLPPFYVYVPHVFSTVLLVPKFFLSEILGFQHVFVLVPER